MLKAFWTWLPVSTGTHRAFDEPFAYGSNRWFFDKSVWQKMFRAMSSCGFDGIVLANTHPFPFLVDLPDYPEARVVSEDEMREYQRMFRWVLETAHDYDISPYLYFSSIYYPSGLSQSRGIDPKDARVPTDFALRYTNYCVRELLSTYPDIVGLYVDVSECVAERQVEFIQQTVIDALDSVRPDAALYVSGCCGDPGEVVSAIKRRGGRPVHYSVKYTHEHLVDSNPDPAFAKWIEAAGGPSVAAEISVSNFEPWSCFSYETVEGILGNLEELECAGLSLHPLSPYDWPRSSDTFFRYQFQRDMVWYSTWGGMGIEKLLRQGQPKWLLRNQRLIPGFQSGSRIPELLALYFAGDRSSAWHPQFCSVVDGASPHLLSIEDMLHLDGQPIFSGDWWFEITGDRVVQLAEYVKSGTPEDAYGPDELIEELTDLSEQAVEAGEKGMRNASGEKELPSFARDALCMGRLGEFYVERIKAALSHARGDNAEALEHMSRALGMYREIRGVDSSHRGPFRVVTDRCALLCEWIDVIRALEAEHADATAGEFKLGAGYPVGRIESGS